MIASFFDGRIRIRREELKDPGTMELVTGLIRNQDGILDLEPNPRTGSLLITYDPDRIPRETLLEAAATLEKQFAAPPPGKKRPARRKKTRRHGIGGLSPLAETGLLGGVYALTLLAGFASKRAHLIGALTLTILAGAHVYNRRKFLL